jgi:outer membrane immunogenic protein
MKKLLLGSAAFLLLGAGVASATDMPIKAPVYKVAAPFSWEGLYVGVHAGYGWGDYKFVDDLTAGGQTATLHPGGWLGGFQIGYNGYLAPNWVLGSEIDFSAADIKANGITSPSAFPVTAKIDFLGTSRLRLGYAMDRTLLYATGGMAWAHVKANESSAGVLLVAPDTYHVGWTIGGGLEYAFDRRWSVKVEYLYADLGKYNNIAGVNIIRSGDLTLSTVKAGLNYRFGDPAPSASALPLKARPMAWSWNGSYIGAHAGYGRGDFHAIDNIVPGFVTNLHPSGWFGGLQSGYNWQFAPNWLFGIETDDSFSGIKQSGFDVPAANPTHVKIDGFDTIRARLGYVMDRSLVYGTGGFALAHVKFNETTLSQWKDYQGGWTIGGGWEYAIDAKWSAKIEYLYADFGRNTDVVNTIGGLAPRSTTLTMNTVKAGLNYKFDLGELLRGH